MAALNGDSSIEQDEMSFRREDSLINMQFLKGENSFVSCKEDSLMQQQSDSFQTCNDTNRVKSIAARVNSEEQK